MAHTRLTNSSLRDQYGLHLQLGFALSLALLLTAAQLPLTPAEGLQMEMETQETVELRHIQQTRHERTPPAPPKPALPRAVPNDQVIEEANLTFDASLDLSTNLAQSGRTPASEEEQSKTDEVFVDVQQRPDCGGLESLQEKIRYPPSASKTGIEGRVFVQFVVGKDGQVIRPRVVRSAHKMLDQAALRAVKRLRCTPGKQRNRPVKVKMTMPVIFALNDNA